MPRLSESITQRYYTTTAAAITKNDEQRERVAGHVERYLQKGGVIKTIPAGVSGVTQRQHHRNYPEMLPPTDEPHQSLARAARYLDIAMDKLLAMCESGGCPVPFITVSHGCSVTYRFFMSEMKAYKTRQLTQTSKEN